MRPDPWRMGYLLRSFEAFMADPPRDGTLAWLVEGYGNWGVDYGTDEKYIEILATSCESCARSTPLSRRNGRPAADLNRRGSGRGKPRRQRDLRGFRWSEAEPVHRSGYAGDVRFAVSNSSGQDALDLRGQQLGLRAGREDELVADLADGADHGLVFGAELGAEAADVDVDGAVAAEVVVAPDLAEQLVAGEDRPGCWARNLSSSNSL